MLKIIESGRLLKRLLGTEDLGAALVLGPGQSGIVRRFIYMLDGVQKMASLHYSPPQVLADYTRTKHTTAMLVKFDIHNGRELDITFMYIGGWSRGLSAQELPDINYDNPWLVEMPKYPDDDSDLEHELAMLLLSRVERR